MVYIKADLLIIQTQFIRQYGSERLKLHRGRKRHNPLPFQRYQHNQQQLQSKDHRHTLKSQAEPNACFNSNRNARVQTFINSANQFSLRSTFNASIESSLQQYVVFYSSFRNQKENPKLHEINAREETAFPFRKLKNKVETN